MDTLHQARRGGLAAQRCCRGPCRSRFSQHLERVWREPDEGIWEVRGGRRHFTYSKVMAWVAFDRAIKGVEAFGLPRRRVDRWRAPARRDPRRRLRATASIASVGSFVQSYGSNDLDASLLLLAAGRFPAARRSAHARHGRRRSSASCWSTDSCCATTPRAVDDGLPPGEGAFLACSFWLADAYVLLGRLDDAERLFTRLVGLRNDVGLLSEEYDPRGKRQLGNFPQAFSHVALVNTAFNLTRADKPAEQRSDLPKGTAKAAEATASA